MTKLPKDQWFNEDIPSDSPAVDELRRLLKEAGYKSPRTFKEEQRKKQEAGKKSVAARRQRAEMRVGIVKQIWEHLDLKYKSAPYSADSVNALCEKYFLLVGKRAAGGESQDLPRTPPTEDELKSFASHVESLAQLPEEDRASALQDELYAFLNPRAPRTEKENDEDEFLDLRLEVLMLSDPERQELQNVSRETLKTDLKSLGVRGRRPTRRLR